MLCQVSHVCQSSQTECLWSAHYEIIDGKRIPGKTDESFLKFRYLLRRQYFVKYIEASGKRAKRMCTARKVAEVLAIIFAVTDERERWSQYVSSREQYVRTGKRVDLSIKCMIPGRMRPREQEIETY